MTPRKRVTTFIVAIAIVTAAIQWPGLPAFLNLYGALGFNWAEGPVGLLKQNSQGLIVFVLLGIFLEWSGIIQSAEEKRKELKTAQALLESALSIGTGRAMVRKGLEDLYGKEASNHLVNNLFRDGSVLKNLVVTLAVKDLDQDHHWVEAEISYASEARRFLVVVADNPAHIEALLITGKISEAFLSEDQDKSVPATIRRIDEDEPSSSKTITDLVFEELPIKAKKSVFNSTNLSISLDKFKLYEAKTPISSKITGLTHCRYIISYGHKQRKSISYTYWMNDRISQIDSISVDLRGMDKSHYSNARLHRFIASAQWQTDVDFRNGTCVLPLNTWSVAGEGVIVTWQHQ